MAKPQALQSTIVTVNAANINLSEPEKELLRCHCRLGHVSFRRVQFLMRTGVLSNNESSRRLHTAACKLASPPKCAACQYGKKTRRPSPGTKTTVVQDRAGVLKRDHLLPGQRVSVDHFVCSTKGRLQTSRGKTADSDMFTGVVSLLTMLRTLSMLRISVTSTLMKQSRPRKRLKSCAEIMV